MTPLDRYRTARRLLDELGEYRRLAGGQNTPDAVAEWPLRAKP